MAPVGVARRIGVVLEQVDVPADTLLREALLGVDEQLLQYSLPGPGSVAAFAESVGDFLRKDVAVARELADRLGSDLGLLDPAIRAAVGSGGPR